jgi:hypothetical protein
MLMENWLLSFHVPQLSNGEFVCRRVRDLGLGANQELLTFSGGLNEK